LPNTLRQLAGQPGCCRNTAALRPGARGRQISHARRGRSQPWLNQRCEQTSRNASPGPRLGHRARDQSGAHWQLEGAVQDERFLHSRPIAAERGTGKTGAARTHAPAAAGWATRQATDSEGRTDLGQILDGNLGVPNYRVDAESRLRKKAGIASDYAQSKSALLKQNPQAIRELFRSDPDAAVYLAFRSHIQQSLGTLRKIDQAKEVISASSESAERKRAAIAMLEKARAQEALKADKLDQAVDLVLQRIHQQRSTGLGNGSVLGSRKAQPSQGLRP
jgi:hypothetical protein